MSLPKELRDQIYGHLYGPLNENNPRLSRKSSIGVARRRAKFGSREPDIDIERKHVLEYFSESEYHHLESVAQRISKLKDSKQIMHEFLEHFFNHTVLDSKTECDWDWSVKDPDWDWKDPLVSSSVA